MTDKGILTIGVIGGALAVTGGLMADSEARLCGAIFVAIGGALIAAYTVLFMHRMSKQRKADEEESASKRP